MLVAIIVSFIYAANDTYPSGMPRPFGLFGFLTVFAVTTILLNFVFTNIKFTPRVKSVNTNKLNPSTVLQSEEKSGFEKLLIFFAIGWTFFLIGAYLGGADACIGDVEYMLAEQLESAIKFQTYVTRLTLILSIIVLINYLNKTLDTPFSRILIPIWVVFLASSISILIRCG
tara:strand:- start:214 stop:729 length:516 start_codon:yes stop_codon:yes gene_type:complete